MNQSTALAILKLGRNVFLTGPAGSGKTYLLRQYLAYLKKHNIPTAVTASTGIAATHMNGVTIHSWSGMGVSDSMSKQELEKLLRKSYLRKIAKTQVLILDEISMLHARQLDLVDTICRMFKQSRAPFGGMQVVFSGDFFQLPPISRTDAPAEFSYTSAAWKELNPAICYLTEQHRQQNDGGLLRILNDVRSSAVCKETETLLATRSVKQPAEHSAVTKLYTHNIDVDRINMAHLQRLPGRSATFDLEERGSKKLVETLKRGCLAPERLTVKRNALVMFVKNNFLAGYVNGTLGTIVDLPEHGWPVVKTRGGNVVVAEPETWSIEEFGRVKAEITQVPLRLAWAITIHKSQGMTLDAAEMDLGQCFDYGMGYVALSRVRELSGITLLGINEMAWQVHPEVLTFDQALQGQSRHVEQEISTVDSQMLQKAQKEFVERAREVKKVKKVWF